ncbi:hypothetical protein J3E72DRAFT_205010, partial [Bipolaris maydis]
VLWSFEATGIAPLQPNVILQRFNSPSPEGSDSNLSSSLAYSGKDWLKIETLLRKVVKEEFRKEGHELSRSIYHISIQNLLLHHKVDSLEQVIPT